MSTKVYCCTSPWRLYKKNQQNDVYLLYGLLRRWSVSQFYRYIYFFHYQKTYSASKMVHISHVANFKLITDEDLFQWVAVNPNRIYSCCCCCCRCRCCPLLRIYFCRVKAERGKVRFSTLSLRLAFSFSIATALTMTTTIIIGRCLSSDRTLHNSESSDSGYDDSDVTWAILVLPTRHGAVA